MVTLEELKTLKVPELKQELKDRGLAQTGRKEDLIKRLEEALAEPAKAEAAPAPAIATTVTDTLPKAGVNGRQPIEFKAKSSEEKLPAATGLTDPADPPVEKPAEARPVTGLSEEEKAKQRAERFGIVSEQDKLAARAKRFGVESKAAVNGAKPATGAGQSADDVAKHKERAKRFNLPEPLSKEEAEKKKKARLERFGEVKATPAEDSGALASKLAARAERFALSKPAPQAGAQGSAPEATAKTSAPEAAVKSTAPVSKRAQSIEEKKQAALAKAAAMVKPAANPEAEAKRQARAIKFQVA